MQQLPKWVELGGLKGIVSVCYVCCIPVGIVYVVLCASVVAYDQFCDQYPEKIYAPSSLRRTMVEDSPHCLTFPKEILTNTAKERNHTMLNNITQSLREKRFFIYNSTLRFVYLVHSILFLITADFFIKPVLHSIWL